MISTSKSTKMKRIATTALSVLLLLSMTACAASETFPEGITTAITNAKNDPELPSNYTNENLVDNPLIESVSGEMFTNPVLSPDSGEFAWGTEAHGYYGIGDPFVMRWNGKYYLYSSTHDKENGIKCSVSDDLVTWRAGDYDGGYCTRETTTAYAPEVVYYNGTFYMYTSPGDTSHKTHKVLTSTSPTGPFKVVGEVQNRTGGDSIDGHVFIDDDGKWYFYKALDNNVMCYEMSSPTAASNSGNVAVSQMHAGGMTAWTEGPMVIKHNGKYYLTYCGNHVWSEGYRINYAVGSSPKSFSEMGDNPLLVRQISSTSDKFVGNYEFYDGLGHSSTVLGPNLDCYYIVYHSIHNGVVGQRQMRINRLAFNGDYMYALGPTSFAAKPTMPTVYNSFVPNGNSFDLSGFYISNGGSYYAGSVKNGIVLNEGTKLLSEATFDTSYTMECNFMYMPSGGRAGVLFNYKNDSNYGKAIFDRNAQTLTVTFVINGKSVSYVKALTKSFGQNVNFDACQLLTVKRDGDHFTFLVNNRELCDYSASLGEGSCGAFAENDIVKVGFTAISTEVNDSSIKTDFKPVTSTIYANTCKETDYEVISSDAQQAVVAKTDDIFNYYISVESGKSGMHDILFRYISYGKTKIKVYQNKQLRATLEFEDTNGQPNTKVFRNALLLNAGCSALTFVFDTSGFVFTDFELDKYAVVQTSTNPSTIYWDGGSWKYWDTLTTNFWSQSGTTWKFNNASYAGKRVFGSFNYGDYEISAKVKITGGTPNAGLIVRVTNPSENNREEYNSDSSLEGTNFFNGYYVGYDANGYIVLGKMSYDWTWLKTSTKAYSPWSGNTFRVRVEGATIKVYIDSETTPCIEYTDPYVYMQGACGIRVLRCTAEISDVKITPIS